MLKTFELKNGIRVATYDLPDLKSVFIKTSVKGGSLVETKKDNGVAHFMEHMLVQGVPSYPTVEELSTFIEGLAGNYNASTSLLNVSFYITLPYQRLEDGLKVASEVFFEPLFVTDSIEKERRAVTEEIRQKMDSHYFKIGEFFRKTRFKANHPMTLSSGGDLEVLAKLTQEDLKKYWKQYFVPRNTYLIIVGNLKGGALDELLTKYFEKFNSKEDFSGFPKMGVTDFSKRQVVIRHDKELKSNYLDFTFSSLNLDDPIEERVKQDLALTILGGLRNSRLYRLLRQERGLVYGVSTADASYPSLGYVYVSSEVSNENLDEVISLIVSALESFIKTGPTQEELEFAKNFCTNQWLMAFDHPTAIASWVEGGLVWNDKIRLPEDFIEMIKDVKVEGIIGLMTKYWDFSKLNLTLQGPLENSKKNISKYTQMIKDLK